MKLFKKLSDICGDKIGLCVGLDPVFKRLPESIQTSVQPLYEFNKAIIEATSDFAIAYKPNLAFYICHGADGWIQLEKTIRAVPEDKIVIVDAKLGDIGNTSVAYSNAVFSGLKADMVTVNPYLGADALQPFIDDDKHGAFILTLTSNEGSADLQELRIGEDYLFSHVINMARKLNDNKNVGLVVGATKPAMWSSIIELARDLPLLVPGIGAQGGNINALRNSLKNYKAPVLVNASRSIIYASWADDFDVAARRAARKMFNELNFN